MYFWYWYWENPNKNPSIILAKFRYLFDITYNAFSIKPNELKSASRCLIGEYEYPFCFAEIYSWVCLYLDTTLWQQKLCYVPCGKPQSLCGTFIQRNNSDRVCIAAVDRWDKMFFALWNKFWTLQHQSQLCIILRCSLRRAIKETIRVLWKRTTAKCLYTGTRDTKTIFSATLTCHLNYLNSSTVINL